MQQLLQHVDVVVSNIMILRMNGPEFFLGMRSNPVLVPMLVILLTTKGMTQDWINEYDAGAYGYLPKPFDSEELITMLDSIIECFSFLSSSDVKLWNKEKCKRDSRFGYDVTKSSSGERRKDFVS